MNSVDQVRAARGPIEKCKVKENPICTKRRTVDKVISSYAMNLRACGYSRIPTSWLHTRTFKSGQLEGCFPLLFRRSVTNNLRLPAVTYTLPIKGDWVVYTISLPWKGTLNFRRKFSPSEII